MWLVWIASVNVKKELSGYERPHKEVQKPLAAEKVTGVSPEQVDNARRAFFSAGAIFATSTLLKAQEKKWMVDWLSLRIRKYRSGRHLLYRQVR